ncbi:MAG: hypothetical protein AAGI54_08190 [Planctomycetota bacterium]
MQLVAQEKFYEKLMAETRDVVSDCWSEGPRVLRTDFYYRHTREPFGLARTTFTGAEVSLVQGGLLKEDYYLASP